MTHNAIQIKKNRVKVKRVILFEFNCSENLIFFAQRFYDICNTLNINSDLYILKGKYRVLLKTERHCAAAVFKMSSLADRTSTLATDIAITQEHARPITYDYAINKIGKAFSSF